MNLGFSEMLFLFLLALIIFGPKKMPEIGRQIGKALNDFKRASNEFKAQIEQEISNLEIENKQTILPPSPTPAGVASRTLNAASSEVSASPAAADSPTTEASTTPATLTDSSDEPLFATHSNPAEVATEAVILSDDVTPSISQESHV
jgi:Tat protein translocase TatB subunit